MSRVGLMVVGMALCAWAGGCALIPAAVSSDMGPEAGVQQHAVGVGNVSTEGPSGGVTAWWAADSVPKVLLAAAVVVVVVAFVWRKFVHAGVTNGVGPVEGGAA